jgi:hypothetical protein
MSSRFRYEMGAEADGYVLLAYKPDGLNSDVAAKYFFDRIYLLNRAICVYKDGSEVVRAEFNDYNGRVPQQMRFSLSNGLVLDIALQEPEFGADIPDKYFRGLEHGDKKIKSFQEIFKHYDPGQ